MARVIDVPAEGKASVTARGRRAVIGQHPLPIDPELKRMRPAHPTVVIAGIKYQIALVARQAPVVRDVGRIRHTTEGSLRNESVRVRLAKELPQLITHLLAVDGFEIVAGALGKGPGNLPTFLFAARPFIELVGQVGPASVLPA